MTPDVVPSAVARHVTERHPHTGALWLASLPERVRDLCQRWDASVGAPLAGASRSLVLAARTADGMPAVMKLEWAPSGSAATLRAFDEAGVGPGVLAAADDHHAVLMRRVAGSSLRVADHANLARTRALVKVLDRVNSVPAPSCVPCVGDAVDSGSRVARDRVHALPEVPFDVHLLDADVEGLVPATRSSGRGLLHGDLTPGNVLDTGTGLVLLDPEPLARCLERDIANGCNRAENGARVSTYLQVACQGAPWLDRYLLGALTVFGARCYVAYALTMHLPVTPEHLELTRARHI